MSKILIITSSFDLTCDYIIKNFEGDAHFFRLNVDRFYEYEISIQNHTTIICNKYWQIEINEIDSIYYRKVSLPDLTNIFDEKYHYYVHREIFTIVEGILESFDGVCLSRPSVLRKADNKVYQLKAAQKVGFSVPESNISNSLSISNSFFSIFKSIVKPISYGKIDDKKTSAVMQTNVVDKEISLKTLQYCPAYFQKFIEKDFDVRVTVVGKTVFPVKIFSDDKVDWRKDYNKLTYELYSLPSEIESMCIRLMNRLNLSFGAIDFVVKDKNIMVLNNFQLIDWRMCQTRI